MNIVEALKRSKETGEAFRRPSRTSLMVQYKQNSQYAIYGCWLLTTDDLVAYDWEPVPVPNYSVTQRSCDATEDTR